MITVKQLIEHLKKFPEEAEVDLVADMCGEASLMVDTRHPGVQTKPFICQSVMESIEPVLIGPEWVSVGKDEGAD